MGTEAGALNTTHDDHDLMSLTLSSIDFLCKEAEDLLASFSDNEVPIVNATTREEVLQDGLEHEPNDECDTELEDFEFLEKPELEEILLWREEFLKSDPTSVAFLTATKESPQKKLVLGLLEKFRSLTPNTQALVLMAMSSLLLVTGYESWPFIIWAWPRLVAFADKFKIAAIATWTQALVNSDAYRKLMIAWETGQPITPALIRCLGPNFMRTVKSKTHSLLMLK